mgnify:CR=1 FL=1
MSVGAGDAKKSGTTNYPVGRHRNDSAKEMEDRTDPDHQNGKEQRKDKHTRGYAADHHTADCSNDDQDASDGEKRDGIAGGIAQRYPKDRHDADQRERPND